MHLTSHVSLLLQVERFVYLTEAALSEQHQQQVTLVEHRVVIEPRLVLVVDTFQFSNMQISLSLQLLHFELQIGVLFFESVLPQLENLVRLVILLQRERAGHGVRFQETAVRRRAVV